MENAGRDINYVKGDATMPIGDGNKIIVHVGGWGRGFVMVIKSGISSVGVKTNVYDFE